MGSSVLQFGYGKFIAFSGYRPQNNLMLLDGTEVNNYNNLPPSGPSGGMFGAETIREFVVKSNGFGAAYGRALGGVVNAVTKSGTNAVHGSLFEFLRNDALDARRYFDAAKPPFHRNQFGGSVGGPIRRDKTFFFGGYEGLRQSRTNSSLTFVPDANLRRGIYPGGLCTKNTSWALIERPYSCAPQAVGAVYDRPGFFVQSHPGVSPSQIVLGDLTSTIGTASREIQFGVKLLF